MTPERFEQIRAVFDAVCELPAAEREQQLSVRCAHDQDIRQQVERLLARNETTAPIDTPAIGGELMIAAAAGIVATPERIGPFRIVRLIGEGGMGSVYEAEQENPRRSVAIKIIRADVLSPEAVRRFEQEAQVLGRFQHPGIACIHEAGVAPTSGGLRPYFAMELVRGTGLSQHVQSHALSVRARLELLVRICEAMDHAHRAGIVHRDLKPSNILVDGSGNPKIVDFGVARISTPGETALTMHTVAGAVVGTIAYMSPEQVSGSGAILDARSDVYSLGVVMFELLTGRLPHNLRECSIPEAARILREDDPSRLSTVDAALRGDLETIVGKALEKEPSRRYATAGAFAEDLRRYLRDEPVLARPLTTLYQVRKFARRHRELVGGIIAAFVVLLAGLAGVSFLAVRESHQRERAEQSATRARWESYRNCIIAADRSLQLSDAGKAIELLDSAPEELRRWEWQYLRSMSDHSLLKLDGHRGAVRGVMVAAGGAIVVSGGADGVISRWNAADGELLGSVEGHREGVNGFAVSPDGTRLLTSGIGGEVAMWHVGSSGGGGRGGESVELWRVKASGQIHAQAFFPDGSAVAVPMGSRVGFLDTETGREVGSLAVPLDDARSAAIGPDGTLLMCEIGGFVAAFDIASGRERWRSTADGFSFGSDGERAWLYSEFFGRIDGLELKTGARHTSIEGVAGRTFSVGTRWLATIHKAGHVSLCDSATGREQATLLGHTAAVTAISLSGDETRVVTGDAGGQIRLWSTSGSGHVHTIRASNDALIAADVSPDGKMLVTAGWGSVKFWDLESGEELRTSFPLTRDIHAARFDRQGRWIALGGYDGTIAVVDARDASVVSRSERVATGISGVAWSSDGSDVFACSLDGKLLRLSTESGRLIWSERVAETALAAVEVSPDGLSCVVAAEDGRVLLFSCGEGDAPLKTPIDIGEQIPRAGGSVPIHSLAFDSTGGMLAAGAADGVVAIFDMSRLRAQLTTRVTGGPDVRSLAFTADGSRLFVGCADASVHVIDTASGDDLLQLHESRTPICRLRAAGDALIAVGVHSPGACVIYGGSAGSAAIAARENQQRSRSMVDERFEQLTFSADVVDAIRGNREIGDEDRQAAIRLATARGDHPSYLNEQAWAVARFPSRGESEYLMALRKAEVACQIRPDQHSYLNTLGVAQFRAGAFEEAERTLVRCTELLRDAGGRPHPLDVIVLAMTHAKLGEDRKAIEGLAAAREIMADDRYRDDAECLWFLAEAEALIAPAESPAAGGG